MEKKPRFEYAGQSSDEILAHLETHSLFSVLYALKWCVEAKARAHGGEEALSDEERAFLAILELTSEVNNGGYRQFFWNNSRRFAPVVVDALRRVDCKRTAELTERAIAALELSELTVDAVTQEIERANPERNLKLEALSNEFYSFVETISQLRQFVVKEQAKIQAPRTENYPRFPKRERQDPSNAEKLYHALMYWKKGWKPSLDEVKDAANTIARERSIPANETDIRGAAVLYYLARLTLSGSVNGSEELAREAFARMRDELPHIVIYRKWIEALLTQGKTATADDHATTYLRFLKEGGRAKQSERSRKHSIVFWARLLHGHRAELPGSVAFFQESFPHVDLDKLPAERMILPAEELYKRTKPPVVEP
ncbi:MAG TPA: DUF4375 domain-containing protein [Acidobacteriaceae bacterium]|jgi:hypothetical protein